MRQIERYVAAEIMRPVIGTLLGLMIVVLAFYASRTLAEAAADRFTIDLVVRLALLRLGMFMDVLVPVALLLGAVIGFGRLQAGHELTALAAVGAGRRRILLALAAPVLALAALVALMSLQYRPWAYATLYELEAALASRVDLAQIEPGRFTPLSREWLLFAERRDNGILESVFLHQRQPDASGLLRADRLHQTLDADGRHRLVFSGGVQLLRLDRDGHSDLLGRFDRLQVLFTPPAPPPRKKLRRAEPLKALRQSKDGMYVAELQWRLLAPVSVLVLALAAVAMSRIDARRGQSVRVLGASLLVTLYFSVLGVLLNWLEQGRMAPWPGVFWLPMVLLTALLLRHWFAQRGPGGPP